MSFSCEPRDIEDNLRVDPVTKQAFAMASFCMLCNFYWIYLVTPIVSGSAFLLGVLVSVAVLFLTSWCLQLSLAAMKIDSVGCEPGCYWFVSMSRNAYIPLGSSPQNYLSESWMIQNKHIYFRLNEKINFKGFGGFFAFQVFLLFMQITCWNEKIALRKHTRSFWKFWSTSVVLEPLVHWYRHFSGTKMDRQKILMPWLRV